MSVTLSFHLFLSTRYSALALPHVERADTAVEAQDDLALGTVEVLGLPHTTAIPEIAAAGADPLELHARVDRADARPRFEPYRRALPGCECCTPRRRR